MSDESSSWGLAGVGVSCPITVELLDPCGDKRPWLLQITASGWHYTFEVEGEEAARALSAFVQEHANREVFAEHLIGTFHSAEVFLVKDLEFADRFWLRIRGDGQMAEVTICGEESTAFRAALSDLVSDLER